MKKASPPEEDKVKTLSTQELVSMMVRFASEFVEFYEPIHLNFYRSCGYTGPDPRKFHTSVADKFLLRHLMEKVAQDTPIDFRNEYAARILAERVLFNEF